MTRDFSFLLGEEQNLHQVVSCTKFIFRREDNTFNNSVINVSIAICWISYIAASAKIMVMAYGPSEINHQLSGSLCWKKASNS